ncbi:MAG: replicative DNA helicase [Smithellaceae bacterium]
MKNNQYRIPPNNIDAEKAVLGAVLLDNKALNVCLPMVTPDDFYSDATGAIFKSMIELSNTGRTIDSIGLCDYLSQKKQLEKVGGHVFVADIMDSAISAANVSHYCQIVKDHALKRRILAAAEETIESVYSGSMENSSEILDVAQHSLMNISTDRKQGDFKAAQELCRTTFKDIEERHKNKNIITGLSTGFRDLNNWTSGLQNGELIIIAGRPAMGKTAFAINIAENVILSGVPVAIFSLEMSGESLMTRIFSSQSGINSSHLRRGFIGDNDWTRLVSVVDQISQAPLFIDDSSVLTPMQLKAKARRLKVEHNIGLIIVDYLQLMSVGGRHDSREREIAEISRSLKALAKELKVPVVALSQLSRKVEDRTIKRPQMYDLRESGSIEQDADVIAFIYRDEIYNQSPDNPERGFAEIIIGKQRNGPTGSFKMRFDAERTRFSDS